MDSLSADRGGSDDRRTQQSTIFGVFFRFSKFSLQHILIRYMVTPGICEDGTSSYRHDESWQQNLNFGSFYCMQQHNQFCSFVDNSVIPSHPRFLICRIHNKEMASKREKHHINCLELLQFCIFFNLLSRCSQCWYILNYCISQSSWMPEVR